MTPNIRQKEAHLPGLNGEAFVASLLLPFEPRTQSKAKIEAVLRRLIEKAANELRQQVPLQQVKQVVAQMEIAAASLDYGTAKRSMVLTATPHDAHVYYWNIPVQEAVVISSEFPVRQLLAHKKIEKNYLVLAMGDHFASIYLGDGTRLTKLVANSPASVHAGDAEAADDLAPLVRAVRHIDAALSILLRSYPYPVFVMAPRENLDIFRKISPNLEHAAALVEAGPDGNIAGLQHLMAPYLTNWSELVAAQLKKQLEEALQRGKLAVGMTEAWQMASEKRGRLLVVESDYEFPAYLDQKDGILYADAIPLSQAAQKVDDAVDRAIIRVLGYGGQVALVPPGSLADYLHVAMICY